MDAIYENMAGVISGYGTSNSEETKRMVELESLIQKVGKRLLPCRSEFGLKSSLTGSWN